MSKVSEDFKRDATRLAAKLTCEQRAVLLAVLNQQPSMSKVSEDFKRDATRLAAALSSRQRSVLLTILNQQPNLTHGGNAMSIDEAERRSDHAMQHGFEEDISIRLFTEIAWKLSPIQRRDILKVAYGIEGSDDSVVASFGREFRSLFIPGTN